MNSEVRSVAISPVSSISAEITPPGSKSITNRALAIAALAEGDSILSGALASEDTLMMMNSLQKMNVALEHAPEKAEIRIHGAGGPFSVPEGKVTDLFCGNSGTTIRFLTAMCANSRGLFRLDGVDRMRQRPLGDLLDGLRQLGVSIKSERGNDCPPVILSADGISGGTAAIHGNVSSQFLSGLLMAAPYAKNETTISVVDGLVSRPYVDMTIAVMKAFGAEIYETKNNDDSTTFRIPPNQKYCGRKYAVEPDASAASYFFAAVAVVGGEILVRNLSQNALQGDVGFCECLAKMGCRVEYLPNAIRVSRSPDAPLHGIDVDMRFISDTAQTLSTVALFADSPTSIRNVANMRVKETDRIHAVVTELQKFGVRVDEFEDGMTIYPLSSLAPGAIPASVEIETYRDHRMAMSFALVGLRLPGVVILDPNCTAKTYPNFFEDLKNVCKTNFKS